MTIKVLVADDSRLLRTMIRDILSLNPDFSIVGEAENGSKALQLYGAKTPHVVLMDIVMPEMDGIESLKRILDLDPQARIIMVSSPGQEGLVMESIVAGAKTFLTKPINPEALIKAIQSVATNELHVNGPDACFRSPEGN